MTHPPDPPDALFLARRGYVRRRLADAARLLPVLGVFLFLLPLLWLSGAQPPRTAQGVLYVFLSWTGLIVVAAWLAPRLMRSTADGPADSTGDFVSDGTLARPSGGSPSDTGPPQSDS